MTKKLLVMTTLVLLLAIPATTAFSYTIKTPTDRREKITILYYNFRHIRSGAISRVAIKIIINVDPDVKIDSEVVRDVNDVHKKFMDFLKTSGWRDYYKIFIAENVIDINSKREVQAREDRYQIYKLNADIDIELVLMPMRKNTNLHSYNYICEKSKLFNVEVFRKGLNNDKALDVFFREIYKQTIDCFESNFWLRPVK